jgi:dihydrofolate reductase
VEGEMKLALIVAMDEQGVIGKENDLPWHLSADLQYFRRVTMGKPIVMGRNTHESIGRPLPGRRNIVITRQPDFQADGCEVVFSIDEALALCKDEAEAMIMGGASLYEQTLPLVDTLYLTRVHAKVEGDTWFPDWSEEDWLLVSREDHQADDKNEFDYSFLQYHRIKKS